MDNISAEAKKILETIRKYGPIRSVEIVKMSGISMKNAYKHLTNLLDERLIKKTGT